MRLRALLPLLLAPALGACTSQWYLQQEAHDLVTTNVEVTTDPPGAMVYFDGVRQAPAPIRIPVEYDHVEQLWSRQNNKFLLYHYREDRRRHVYGHNVHRVSASLSGHEQAEREVVLEGQETVPVHLTLPKR